MPCKFTYIDHILKGILHVLDRIATRYPNYYIGNHVPVEVMTFLHSIDSAAGTSPLKIFRTMQIRGVAATSTATETLKQVIDPKPKIELVEGINGVDWCRACTSV
jgi:UDP-glucuronate 4-epimerase